MVVQCTPAFWFSWNLHEVHIIFTHSGVRILGVHLIHPFGTHLTVSILNITTILIQYVFQWDSPFGSASCGDEHHFRYGIFPCSVYTSLHSLAIVEQCRP
jgi:hypothetical protein